MTDPRSADPAPETDGVVAEPAAATASGAPTPAAEATGAVVSTSPTGPTAKASATTDPGLERRAFVRRMGSDAVRTAGSVFSLSRILTRSAAAAGQSVMGELERLQAPVAEAGAATGPLVPASDLAPTIEPAAPPVSPGPIVSAEGVVAGDVATAAPLPVAASAIAAPPSDLLAVATAAIASRAATSPSPTPDASAGSLATTPARPIVTLDAEQRLVLESAATAVIAVNRSGHPPQLTAASVLWDGETLRFMTLGWSRRTTMLRADPLVGAFVEGTTGAFVTVTGRARIVEGRGARDEAWPLLLRESGGDEDAAADRWLALLAEDVDRAVVVIEPDQVLTGRR